MKIVKIRKKALIMILNCERVHDYDYLKEDNCYQIYAWDRKGKFHIKHYQALQKGFLFYCSLT